MLKFFFSKWYSSRISVPLLEEKYLLRTSLVPGSCLDKTFWLKKSIFDFFNNSLKKTNDGDFTLFPCLSVLSKKRFGKNTLKYFPTGNVKGCQPGCNLKHSHYCKRLCSM